MLEAEVNIINKNNSYYNNADDECNVQKFIKYDYYNYK